MTISRKLIALKTIAAVAVTAGMLSMTTPGAFAQGAQSAPSQQGVTQVQDEVRNVLSQYGRFVQHQKYGEVWVPTATPQGWHPYPPCNWVNSRQYGWYYDDKTAWGAIVHHYGRWVHDPAMGWIWTPGSEFSPGWVVWRTSPEWVGWAPMLPDEDVQTIPVGDFNNGGYWTFVETAKFAQGCTGNVAPPAQIPVLLTETSYVTDMELVAGVTVFVLPQYVVGPLIDINIVFGPWPSWFLAQTLIDWNFIWNNLVVVNAVVYHDCGPQMMKHAQTDAPKPPPVKETPTPAPIQPPPGKVVDTHPPVVEISHPVCPPGTAFADGACRLPDACHGYMVRVGNACVPPVVKPPIRVIDNPCGNLSGGEFQRCIRGTPPTVVDNRPPVTRPPGGTPPVGPVGNQPSDGRTNGPVGTPPGTTKLTIGQPNVTFHPNGPRPVEVRPAPPSNRLPATTSVPIRTNPNPVVLRPGGGGMNKMSVASNQQAGNNASAPRRRLPMALPQRGNGRT